MIRTTILVDDRLEEPLKREHGLSVWCEITDQEGKTTRVLLDTGQHGKTLARNAKMAGIDLSTADYIVVSHGHYDHSGGLEALTETCSKARLIISPLAPMRRYSVQMSEGERRMKKENGMPAPDLIDYFEVTHIGEGETHCISDAMTVFTLPHAAPPNPRLLAEGDCPDTFPDEIFVLLTDGNEKLLYSGCTHHGLHMLLDYVFNTLDVIKINTFVGGLHLMGKKTEEIKETAKMASQYPVDRWYPVHCTGDETLRIWADRMKVFDK